MSASQCCFIFKKISNPPVCCAGNPCKQSWFSINEQDASLQPWWDGADTEGRHVFHQVIAVCLHVLCWSIVQTMLWEKVIWAWRSLSNRWVRLWVSAYHHSAAGEDFSNISPANKKCETGTDSWFSSVFAFTPVPIMSQTDELFEKNWLGLVWINGSIQKHLDRIGQV